ncbi:NUDIX domain-containing protein [Allosaccharopolyspora coralli]|uniref:NUDIX domain-containing protein n=1 Tax=Allosaccharopolyspora coralli TaxID=2665642 RepID=A0A5Q3Q5U6_9PSEU|nr:NUDIX domain-containing protein [Allosaccharopolyspora coralli]QGK70001.1 NUDIX domain-containing protein [Allosaccharopolyspora coralli]
MTEFAREQVPPAVLSEQSRDPRLQYVVGAVILDGKGRAYIQQRSWHVRHFPGCWDIVGGHVEPGETLHQALAREVEEETGWDLTRVHRAVSHFDWCGNDGITRREIDVVAEAAGDLSRPVLERDKFINWAWADENTLRRLARLGTSEESVMIRMCLNVIATANKQ